MAAPLRSGLLAFAAVLSACAPDTPQPTGLPAHPIPVRAVDVVSAPVHEAPVSEAPPLFVDSFEGVTLGWDEPSPPGGKRPLPVELVADDELFRIGAPDVKARARRFQQVVAVPPGAALRFTARVRTDALTLAHADTKGAGFLLEELAAKDDPTPLARHDLPRLRGTSPWTPVEAVFRASNQARFLRIWLESGAALTSGVAAFDDVRLSLADPTAAAATWPPVLTPGVPVRDGVRRLSFSDETRPALVAGPGTRWAFAVDRAREARLHTGIVLLPGATEAQGACFRVWAAGDAQPLVEKCLKGGKKPAWEGLSVPLPALPGTTTELVLETTGDAAGAWGDPRVVPSAADPRPDVILLVFDTTRWDHLGSAGYTTRVTTPHLDAWLAGAVDYLGARSGSPWTAASLGSVVTGRYAGEHGAGRRLVPVGEESADKAHAYGALVDDVPTLADLLSADGYTTLGLAANGFFSPSFGFDRGFDRYLMYQGSDYAAARTGVKEAVAMLKAKKDKDPPLFLTLHFVDPHHPYRMRLPPFEGYARPAHLKLDGGDKSVSLTRVTPAAQAYPDEIETLYDAETRWVDEALATLLPAIPDDALVIGLADHGEGFGEHGLFIHGNSLYEELLHVPLFVRYPHGEHGGAVVRTPVSLLDVLPTVFATLGRPAPAALPGEVLPIADHDAARVLFGEAMYSGPDRISAFDGRWKYLFTQASAFGDHEQIGESEALYDLAGDPGETTDLAPTAPEVLSRLRTATRAHLAATFPGVHLRCRPTGPLHLHVEPAGRIVRIGLEEGDELRKARGAVDVTLDAQAPGDEDWLVFASGVTFTGDRAACDTWTVDTKGASEAGLDAETVEGLEGLGYLGG
jgi:arylsulfatase A-like enzyme